MLSNIEFVEQFLVWREQPEDRSPEAFQRHLEISYLLADLPSAKARVRNVLADNDLPKEAEGLLIEVWDLLEGNVKP